MTREELRQEVELRLRTQHLDDDPLELSDDEQRTDSFAFFENAQFKAAGIDPAQFRAESAPRTETFATRFEKAAPALRKAELPADLKKKYPTLEAQMRDVAKRIALEGLLKLAEAE